jgi:hypothetical protein
MTPTPSVTLAASLDGFLGWGAGDEDTRSGGLEIDEGQGKRRYISAVLRSADDEKGLSAMRKKMIVLALCMLGALALGATSASAATANNTPFGPQPEGNAFTNWAPIQETNGDCGENLEELPVAGIVRFTRTGNLLRLAVTFYGAPNTRYNIDVAGDLCYYLGRAGTFYTNAYGYGKASGTIAIPGWATYDEYFFADIDEYGFYGPSNDTPYAYVP